ncbi:MAG: hypothetical protein ACFFER_20360 [Candidatus Thorarchaeota archaeon]
MNDADYQYLSDLLTRGKEIQNQIDQLRGSQGFTALVDFWGKFLTSQLDPIDRDTGKSLADASVSLLSNPVLNAKQHYQDWYLDCRMFFAKMGWNSNSLVRAFLEAGHIPIGKETGVTVEMVIHKQIVILEQIQDTPPKPWHIAKAIFLVSYIALCVFIDIVLFAFIGLATIPAAAFEVALIVAFPKIERWLKND